MLKVYAIKDVKEKLVGRGIFVANNDLVARRMIAVSLNQNGYFVGIEDKFLICIGTFDEDTGIIAPNEKNQVIDICALTDILKDVTEEKKKHVN